MLLDQPQLSQAKERLGGLLQITTSIITLLACSLQIAVAFVIARGQLGIPIAVRLQLCPHGFKLETQVPVFCQKVIVITRRLLEYAARRRLSTTTASAALSRARWCIYRAQASGLRRYFVESRRCVLQEARWKLSNAIAIAVAPLPCGQLICGSENRRRPSSRRPSCTRSPLKACFRLCRSAACRP